MKMLLIGEFRQGKPVAATAELVGFAETAGAEAAMVVVGEEGTLPAFSGRLYVADSRKYGEYRPEVHQELVLEAVEREQPDAVVFIHSSYGWDLAPRIAFSLKAAQVSGVVAMDGAGGYDVECCNGKLRRTVSPHTSRVVLTLQAGAFPAVEHEGEPELLRLDTDAGSPLEFAGYKPFPGAGIDLSKARVVVSAGRGIGSGEHVALVRDLARVLDGEVGASRPVIDAGWLEWGRQVGSTGQNVSPDLYIACGISGAVQHVAGMKGAKFVVAVNTDREAPIADVSDVVVVADLVQFLPALTAALERSLR